MLWALIALPTLTVLIGAIGDIVSEFVEWYTEWLSRHSTSIYMMFKALGAKHDKAGKVKQAVKKADNNNKKTDDPGFEHIANLERKHTVPLDISVDGLSQLQADIAEETYRPFIMLKAAHAIVEHLDADPPRRYTYKEWTWLLKLLGEDETDADGHRVAGAPLRGGAEVQPPIRQESHHVWSWLGQESPLMSVEDGSEPKWVLKRIMWNLERDLKQRAERKIERDIGPVEEIKTERLLPDMYH